MYPIRLLLLHLLSVEVICLLFTSLLVDVRLLKKPITRLSLQKKKKKKKKKAKEKGVGEEE